MYTDSLRFSLRDVIFIKPFNLKFVVVIESNLPKFVPSLHQSYEIFTFLDQEFHRGLKDPFTKSKI